MQYNKEFLEKAMELQKKAQDLTNNTGWQQDFMESMMKAFQGWGMSTTQPNKKFDTINDNLKMLSNLWSSEMPLIEDNSGLTFNINESDYDISLNAPLPGIKSPNDLTVKIQGDTIIISGKSSNLKGNGEVANFSRVVKLPAYVETEGATAIYHRGYLNIRLPKKRSNSYEINVKFR